APPRERAAAEIVELAVQHIGGQRIAPMLAEWAARQRLQSALLALAGIDHGLQDDAACRRGERRDDVLDGEIVEGEAEIRAELLIGEVHLERVRRRRLQVWVTALSAADIEKAYRRIERLEIRTLDTARITEVDVQCG